MPFYVYCLATVEEPIQTYIGATIDLDRRLAQHNKERAGGARLTARREGEWYRVCAVEGFQTWKEALSFEWHWKWYSKKSNERAALERRQKGLDACMTWWGDRCTLSIIT